jgi:hypothetical protein
MAVGRDPENVGKCLRVYHGMPQGINDQRGSTFCIDLVLRFVELETNPLLNMVRGGGKIFRMRGGSALAGIYSSIGRRRRRPRRKPLKPRDRSSKSRTVEKQWWGSPESRLWGGSAEGCRR